MDNQINRGDFYEDCAYHPLLCTVADYEKDHAEGISLIDGTVRCCSLCHCGVRKLTAEEVIKLRLEGPDDDTKAWYEKNSPKRIWWK